MDMLKVVKIRSVENADYTTQYNRMRFKVPADNLNTHLDESYLSLQVQPTNANGQLPAKNLNIGFGNGEDNLPYYPTCLIKVARLFSGDSNIPLEEINRFNLLDLNMKIYQKDLENLASDQYESGFFVDNLFQADKSPFYLEGGIDIHIPLKDIFGLCKNKDFYLSNTGGLQIELELEDQYSLFIANSEANIGTQRVYTSFNGVQSVTPFSNLNSNYISSSQPQSEVAPVPLDPSEKLPNQELINLSADTDNFYISISNVTIGSYDNTTKRFSVTLQVSLTDNTIIDKSKEYKAFGIGGSAGSLIFQNSNWKQIPMSLVYKKTDTPAGSLFGRPLQNLNATFNAFNPSGTPTNATIVAELPWENNTPPSGLTYKAIACNGKLSLATEGVYNQLNLTNVIDPSGTTFPKSYAKINGTIEQICDGTGDSTADPVVAPSLALTLGTGNTYPKITIASGALGSVELVIGAKYIVNMQEIQGATLTSWSPSEVLNDSRINTQKIWKGLNGGRLVLNATDETVLTFEPVIKGTDAANVIELNKIIQTQVQETAFNIGEIFLQMIAQPVATTTDELDEVEQTQLTYSIPRAELVLVQESKKSSDNISNVYMTWKMEPTLIESTTAYWQKQFILEPNVASVCLLYPPQATTGVQSMYSSDSGITTYRWALDNIDNTNRDVVINEALHNDKLIDWFNNTNMKLKSFPNSELLESNLSLIPMKIYSAVDDENMYMDNKSHTLQVVLKANDVDVPLTQKNLYLFKQVLKTL